MLFKVHLQKQIKKQIKNKFHKKKKSSLTLFSHPNNHPYDSDLIEIDKKTGKFRLSRKVLIPKPEK